MRILRSLKTIVLFTLLTSLYVSCSEDEGTTEQQEPFVAAFETLSTNLSTIEDSQDVSLIYSETATENGQITLSVTSENAVYGEDFTTTPALDSENLFLPINQGENGTDFTFTKLNPNLDETVEIIFTISDVDYPAATIQGNSTFTLNSSASQGRGYAPEVGGPNQQNQVYIDLSSEGQTTVQRDTWDLGFWSGADRFRVTINGSIYMAAAQLESTNIDAITEADVAALQEQVAVGTFNPANEAYIDSPDGNIEGTAIATISANDAENNVYLVNLGYEVGTVTPEAGSVEVAGDARGWKKIRILRDGDAYRLQYADINETSHQEVLIEKSNGYNFTFFSFDTNEVVSVAPQADSWDINFTVFTNILEGAGSYGFSDGVLHNRNGGVVAYSVSTDDIEYDAFGAADVVSANFSQDQRVIGSSWRDVFSEDKVLIDTIYYIIQDPNGNIYKLKFTALLNENGERGYPEFKYNLIQ